jgi:hypothetical protein
MVLKNLNLHQLILNIKLRATATANPFTEIFDIFDKEFAIGYIIAFFN